MEAKNDTKKREKLGIRMKPCELFLYAFDVLDGCLPVCQCIRTVHLSRCVLVYGGT